MFYKSILCFASVVALAAGHGVFWTPENRATISEKAGDQPDASMIIAEPMPDVASDRPYPGGRPFAEPGKSISNIGPCGSISYSPFTNWNKPDKSWGNVTTTYRAGDIVDVEWCVDSEADHGGVYSYRICQDDAIVAKYINASYTPTTSDWTDMETCLQAGILSCTDVPGQDCPVSPDCQSGWGCEKATSWFTCGGKDSGRCMSKGVADCTVHGGHHGRLLRNKIKIPKHASKHTILAFRWDCMDTGQLWLNCADIEII